MYYFQVRRESRGRWSNSIADRVIKADAVSMEDTRLVFQRGDEITGVVTEWMHWFRLNVSAPTTFRVEQDVLGLFQGGTISFRIRAETLEERDGALVFRVGDDVVACARTWVEWEIIKRRR